MDDKIEAILAHTDAMVCDGCVGDYKGRAEKIGLVQDQKCRACGNDMGSHETVWLILKNPPA
jgi:hypothetical protein